MNPIEIFFLVFQLAALYVLFRTVAGLNLRLNTLERQPSQPIFKAPPPVQESHQEGRPEKQTRATETDVVNASYSWDVNYRK